MHYEEKILNVHKPVGISPLDAIRAFKEKYPKLKDEKMTYAGRLDPMAEGVLILLAGNAVHEKEKYLKLDKEYGSEILFGFKTDTYDALGIPSVKPYRHSMSIDNIKEALRNFEGKISLPLPPYSSYKIKGKPLFQWAREGKLSEIKIPERKTTVYEIKFLGLKNISGEKLLQKIEQKINLIRGDFRQEEILNQWNKIVNKNKYQIAKIKITCSSGTYVRSVAHKLGQDLETGAVLLGLKRTSIGDFNIKNATKIKLPS